MLAGYVFTAVCLFAYLSAKSITYGWIFLKFVEQVDYGPAKS